MSDDDKKLLLEAERVIRALSRDGKRSAVWVGGPDRWLPPLWVADRIAERLKKASQETSVSQ